MRYLVLLLLSNTALADFTCSFEYPKQMYSVITVQGEIIHINGMRSYFKANASYYSDPSKERWTAVVDEKSVVQIVKDSSGSREVCFNEKCVPCK